MQARAEKRVLIAGVEDLFVIGAKHRQTLLSRYKRHINHSACIKSMEFTRFDPFNASFAKSESLPSKTLNATTVSSFHPRNY